MQATTSDAIGGGRLYKIYYRVRNIISRSLEERTNICSVQALISRDR
jgi:hypothetical protein